MKPATERYVRSVVESNGIELVLGIAYTDATEYFTLLSVSKRLLRDAVASLSGSHAVTNPALLAEAVEAEVVKQWPERYWFVEICSAGDRDGWTQVFQPAPRETVDMDALFEWLNKDSGKGGYRMTPAPSTDAVWHLEPDEEKP